VTVTSIADSGSGRFERDGIGVKVEASSKTFDTRGGQDPEVRRGAESAQNAMSTLSCQTSGSTLSRSLDDVSKLSVPVAAFAAGSVGFAVNTKAGVAHRADNFSAPPMAAGPLIPVG